MKKKSFTLFSTLILVFIFSMLTVKIFEVKSISSINIENQYNYIQGKNHLIFLEEYLNSLNDLSGLDKIQIENNSYDIYALVKKVDTKYEIELIVEAIDFDIRIYKKIFIIG